MQWQCKALGHYPSFVVLDRVLVLDVALQSGRQATVVLAVPLTNAPQIADAAALGIVALVLVG